MTMSLYALALFAHTVGALLLFIMACCTSPASSPAISR